MDKRMLEGNMEKIIKTILQRQKESQLVLWFSLMLVSLALLLGVFLEIGRIYINNQAIISTLVALTLWIVIITSIILFFKFFRKIIRD
jgi:hypothetical protein